MPTWAKAVQFCIHTNQSGVSVKSVLRIISALESQATVSIKLHSGKVAGSACKSSRAYSRMEAWWRLD
eukprot:5854595-Amphidinium_carterae.1